MPAGWHGYPQRWPAACFPPHQPYRPGLRRIDGYQTTRRRRHAIRLKGGIEVKREGSSAFCDPWCAAIPRGQMIWRCGSALARRRFQAPEQQRQHGVDPPCERRIAPFLGMGGMMETDGGVEHRARRDLDVGDMKSALLHAVGQNMRNLIAEGVPYAPSPPHTASCASAR